MGVFCAEFNCKTLLFKILRTILRIFWGKHFFTLLEGRRAEGGGVLAIFPRNFKCKLCSTKKINRKSENGFANIAHLLKVRKEGVCISLSRTRT